jgi:hypothetical protein
MECGYTLHCFGIHVEGLAEEVLFPMQVEWQAAVQHAVWQGWAVMMEVDAVALGEVVVGVVVVPHAVGVY